MRNKFDDYYPADDNYYYPSNLEYAQICDRSIGMTITALLVAIFLLVAFMSIITTSGHDVAWHYKMTDDGVVSYNFEPLPEKYLIHTTAVGVFQRRIITVN